MVTIELVTHKGIQESALGWVENELNQWMVRGLNPETGKWILLGYLGKDPQRKFCPLLPFVELPDALQAEVVSEISRLAGRVVDVGIAPLPVAALAAVDADEDETTEYEDDE